MKKKSENILSQCNVRAETEITFANKVHFMNVIYLVGMQCNPIFELQAHYCSEQRFRWDILGSCRQRRLQCQSKIRLFIEIKSNMNIISKFQLVVYFQCCVLIKVKVKVFILDIFDQLVRFCYKTIKPLALMATEPNPIDSEPIRARGKIVKYIHLYKLF